MRFAAALAALAIVTVALPVVADEGDPSQPGAYCPFPKKGEKPACFDAVESEYSDFFAAVEGGEVDGEPVADLERALQGDRAGADRTLALSSLAYGYYLLAQRTAAAEDPDPALVARLETWNELLGSVYQEAQEEPDFRSAVKEAALDLHAHAPAVSCEEDGSCPDTGLLLQTLRGIDDPAEADTGVRGALGRVLGRMLGDGGEAAEPGGTENE